MRPGYAGTKLHARILRGKGVVEEETNHVHCGKLNKRNFCPTSASRHMCSSADKEDGDRHVMWSNDQAEAGAKISK